AAVRLWRRGRAASGATGPTAIATPRADAGPRPRPRAPRPPGRSPQRASGNADGHRTVWAAARFRGSAGRRRAAQQQSGGRASDLTKRERPARSTRAGRSPSGQPPQWRNRNSFELISAQWTSSQALRLLAFLATCPSAASTSPAFGSRDSVARYSSLRISLSANFFASSLPTRLVGARNLSLTVGPLMSCRACARLLSLSRSHSQASSRAG